MLRIVVLLLVLANGGFYAWRQGWLDGVVGVSPQGDREPARLARQVQPERVRVLPPGTRGAAAASPAAGMCLEVGPFTPPQRDDAVAAVQGVVPPDRVEDVRREAAAVWIVFVGPFPEAEVRARRVEELRRQRMPAQEVRDVPELGDGLSLGRFDTRAAAERALREFTANGVRTARLAQYAPPVVTHTLRVRGVGPDLQAQLRALQVPGLAGRGFGACSG